MSKCLRQAQDFEGRVHAFAVGQLAHACADISGCRVDEVGRAETFGRLELVIADIDRDDLRRAECFRNLNDVDADTAGGDYRDAFTAAQFGAMPDGAIRGEDGAAEYRRLFERQAVDQRKDVGCRYYGVLRKAGHRIHRDRRTVLPTQPRRAVVQRALQPIHREEVVAEVVTPRTAGGAEPAGHDECRGDLRSNRGTWDTGSQRSDRAGDLVTHHGRRRECDFRLHHVQVGVAHTARTDLHEDFAGAGFGYRNFLDAKAAGRGIEDRCFHCLHRLSLSVLGSNIRS